MLDAAVDQVRSFNRLVTERVGALNDRYLARDRPLGEARLLWEIGVEGCDVRRLRARLGLDSGYLSRLLRSLEAGGLVSVEQSANDKRVRTVQLTPAGLAERDLLDRRSDELARSFLEPLSEPRRERLVAAMAEVERLLTAALVEIGVVDPAERDAQFCLREYFAELGRRFDTGFDPAREHPRGARRAQASGRCLPARDRCAAEPVGCGALKFHGGEPDRAQTHVGRRIGARSGDRPPAARRAREPRRGRGADVVRLETNKALAEAISLYRSAGYREVDAFNDEPYAHHWFEKRLPPKDIPREGERQGGGWDDE